MSQWVFKITKYSQELLDALDTLDRWPDRGARDAAQLDRPHAKACWCASRSIRRPRQNGEIELKIFTTRHDTLFGAKFMAIAADHPLAQAAAAKNPKLAEFIAEVKTHRHRAGNHRHRREAGL